MKKERKLKKKKKRVHKQQPTLRLRNTLNQQTSLSFLEVLRWFLIENEFSLFALCRTGLSGASLLSSFGDKVRKQLVRRAAPPWTISEEEGRQKNRRGKHRGRGASKWLPGRRTGLNRVGDTRPA